jgi:hypothetical protein
MPLHVLRVLLFILAAVATSFAQKPAINVGWLPVTEAERQLLSPMVEPGAGVEALFWRVHVLDELMGSSWQRVLHHYVRLKVFNEEGRNKAATIDIQYGDKEAIMYIEGRTIKPDGGVVELEKSSIHDRDLIRAGGLKRKVKSFAMPGVEPGAIVEYRWREIREEPRSLYTRLQLQREFPVQRVTYFVKPLPLEYTSFRLSVWPFNCRTSPLKLEHDGFNSIFLEKVPAFREEPMMPAEPNVRPWMLVYYHEGQKRDPKKYWNDVGKDAFRELKGALRVNGEMKQAAAQAVAGAQDEQAKVVQLIRYVRSNFRGLFESSVTEGERARIVKEMPKNRYRTSAEVFKSGVGTADELNTLFAALASEVGLDARPALIGSRKDLFFADGIAERYFLRNLDMAVKLGDQWKLFDVSARLLPASLLYWYEEGVRALVADPKEPTFITTPPSSPETSTARRSAELTLSEDGSLEGDVEEKHTGHTAYGLRDEFEGEAETRQREQVKERLTRTYPQAEVTEIAVENAADPDQALCIRYHIRIPGYAQRTGKRLFFQPLYFQRGDAPVFSAGERQYDIHFPHAWKEADRVAISLPDGFTLDNAENPGNLNFGDPGSYALNMKISGRGVLLCERQFTFGNNGAFLFAKAAYPQLKKLFDEIHRRDSHTLSIRQAAQ